VHPDYLFIGMGILVLCVAVALLAYSFRTRSRLDVLTSLLWACLGIGFLFQGFAPHFEIKNNKFIIPSLRSVKPIDHAALVQRERRMQLLSALFTGGAALGLALRYRSVLIKPNRRHTGSPSAHSPMSRQ